MKALETVNKKEAAQTYNRAKSDQDSVAYRHKTETDFVGSGFHPPERFVPLVRKFSHPANVTQRTQLFNQLQRHYGNRYVQRVVSAYRSQNIEEEESKLASGIVTKKGSGRSLEPGNQAVQRLFNPGVIQAKLKIGQPGDKYEQEADRIAQQVMRMPEQQVQRSCVDSSCFNNPVKKELIQSEPLSLPVSSLIQRQSTEIKRKKKTEEFFQTKRTTGGNSEVFSDIDSSINSLKGSGQPLSQKTRSYFEPRFGHDFSDVRVHSDAHAAQSAAAINARAYTLGRNIVFGAGQYQPDVKQGQRLLAHELTHVIQQSGRLNMLQLLRWSNNGVDFDSTITMRQILFNSGPGRVGIDPGRIIASRNQGSPQRWLLFYTGSTARGAQPGAWHFTPEHRFSFSTTSTVQPSGHYIGFVQTVGRIHNSVQYENIAQPFAATVTNARDADDPNVPSPWYNHPGQRSGPVNLWNQQAPEIFDMPTILLRVWGHQSAAQNPLRTVTAEGTFYIWLVVKHQNDPGNQINSLSFLYHMVVEYNRSWTYSGSGSPYDRDDPANYPGTGSQQITSQGEGRGSHTPVLTGSTAKEQIDPQTNQWSFPGP